MDQKTKDEITAQLRAEYRETVKRTADEERKQRHSRPASGPKSMGVAYLLWFFFGTLGGHRFYLGRIASAAVMAALALTGTVITFALLRHDPPSFVGVFFSLPVWIWWLVDAFLIPRMTPDQ